MVAPLKQRRFEGDTHMKLVHINKVGTSGDLYVVREFHAPVDPDYGVGGGNRPDQGLPGSGGRPDNTLPGMGGRPDQGLPGSGNRPDNSLPGGPGHPDNRPPSRPPTVGPGQTLILVRDPEGVWHYATTDNSSPPPRPVPVPPPTNPPTVDNTLPPTGEPKAY
jgi:hypothetical protein